MPRGRHRHSPPLHRLLPPSAIAGVSLVCAFGPWVFSQPAVLRVHGRRRRGDRGRRRGRHAPLGRPGGQAVADLTRARASDEWRYEERVAELETDLEESRELRVKLEQRLRAKRTELAGLRNEHAALLRRYATAETERASALEGRRLLEIEADPARGRCRRRRSPRTRRRPWLLRPSRTTGESDHLAAIDEGPEAPRVLARGSRLFLRADAALERSRAAQEQTDESEARTIVAPEGAELFLTGEGRAGALRARTPTARSRPSRRSDAKDETKRGPPRKPRRREPVKAASAEATARRPPAAPRRRPRRRTRCGGSPRRPTGMSARPPPPRARAAQPGRQPSGHFIAPTAVAVVPHGARAAPAGPGRVRLLRYEGGRGPGRPGGRAERGPRRRRRPGGARPAQGRVRGGVQAAPTRSRGAWARSST